MRITHKGHPGERTRGTLESTLESVHALGRPQQYGTPYRTTAWLPRCMRPHGSVTSTHAAINAQRPARQTTHQISSAALTPHCGVVTCSSRPSSPLGVHIQRCHKAFQPHCIVIVPWCGSASISMQRAVCCCMYRYTYWRCEQAPNLRQEE